jgi:hypothetical protein
MNEPEGKKTIIRLYLELSVKKMFRHQNYKMESSLISSTGLASWRIQIFSELKINWPPWTQNILGIIHKWQQCLRSIKTP